MKNKRIVLLTGGIGTQLFQYVLMCYLRSKGYSVYYKDETHAYNTAYNGLELDKYFKINIKPIPLWLYLFLKFYWHYFPKQYEGGKSRDDNFSEHRLFFMGKWMSKKYWSPAAHVQFKKLPLNEVNAAVLKQIQSTESVGVHVRRGDYLREDFVKRFGGVCTLDYYRQAISFMQQKMQHPIFFVFSDDIPWCKEHLQLSEAVFVDWNKGHDNIYDMYLMSHCKANIIANSKFSYWGAFISTNSLVVYPKKWYADGQPAPDIFPQSWTGM